MSVDNTSSNRIEIFSRRITRSYCEKVSWKKLSRKNEDGKENLYEHDELSSCSRRFGFNCFIQAYYEETEEEHSKEFCDFLNGRGGCSKAQVLVDNGTTWSFINQRFAKKLPLTYLLRKFVISLKNGKVCCTKGKFSVDLKFVDGMNSKKDISKSLIQRLPMTSF